MAIKRVFACDRCPHEEYAKKAAKGGGVTLPNGGSTLQWYGKRMRLCRRCATELDNFLSNTKPMRNRPETSKARKLADAAAQNLRGDLELLSQKAIR